MIVAITRAVSDAIGACELTHLDRVEIDVGRAREQHRAYEAALATAGAIVERLPADDRLPDSVFVEDAALVFDELAVITRPGAESRRPETAAVAAALASYRRLHTIEAPATVDGGDVLTVGRRVYVGVSTRTNAAAAEALRRILTRYGYTVCATTVSGFLHLKSAVTALDDSTLLVRRPALDVPAFDGFELVDVDPREPAAANALRVGDRIIFPTAFPRTAERIAQRGYRIEPIDASELAKAEGAVTCCSLIVPTGLRPPRA
jgi:dimethylargininase